MSTPAGSTLYSPANDQVLLLATQIRNTSPSIGFSKLLSTLKSHEPTWTLSEKVLPVYILSPLTLASQEDPFETTDDRIVFDRHFAIDSTTCCSGGIASKDDGDKWEGTLLYG
jgi:hypothetical protein